MPGMKAQAMGYDVLLEKPAIDDSIESHIMGFMAEESRKKNNIMDMVMYTRTGRDRVSTKRKTGKAVISRLSGLFYLS